MKVVTVMLGLFLYVRASKNPDARCLKSSECDDATTPNQCCGYKKQVEPNTGIRLFTCINKDDAAKLNYQCVESGLTFCDYCQLKNYCCEYQTNLVDGLIASCQTNTSVLKIPNSTVTPNPNLTQQYYRCMQKTTGTDHTSGALHLISIAVISLSILLLSYSL